MSGPMRVGIGLPAAVPGVDATTIGDWAAAAERTGFASLGVFDRLVYDNLEPLIALAGAAARTEEIELLTTVLTVGWRNNAVLLAKQIASVDLLSGGRLTMGVGLGGWPEDFVASEAPSARKGTLEQLLGTMRSVWSGSLEGKAGPTRRLPAGRPKLLFGGFVPAAYARAATQGEGWVSPLFGFETLTAGVNEARKAWAQAGRSGRPRIATGRYFSLGARADAVADEYIHHYYGDEYFAAGREDTMTSAEQVGRDLERLARAGATDVVLYPCSAGLDQVERLSDAVRQSQHARGRDQ
jgi:alkanesulfonate monooxygenase SsuD/methylene tetrahydromethanopterin reductase-like flavin-dependent oxidoreductase (luciferase family)